MRRSHYEKEHIDFSEMNSPHRENQEAGKVKIKGVIVKGGGVLQSAYTWNSPEP